ncbi:hypothetical protein [Aestuariivirga sp.]|uniref:hypothetical protein n=1 Tax=Aestuariivirga sp. TaxID=2650926 RepID=UPI0035B386A5
MAKKAKKKVTGKAGTTSKKTRKVIAVKSMKAKKPAAKKPARKATRRSSADVAKLQKAVIKGLKAGKSAEALAAELGVSRPYIYVLKNKG